VPVITHGGGINGFTTTIVRYPNEKNLIVMLDNTGSGYLNRLSESLAKILYNQPYDPPKISIVEVLEKTIAEKGVAAGVAQYRDLKAKQPAMYEFAEPELNRLGYQLLRSGKPKEAIEIFKLNVEAYPQAYNTYDSLAEAYMTVNERELAIQNYKKSIELNPKNTNGVEALKRLENPPAKIDAATLDKYVGTYELAPGFSIAVTREGETLFAQATGQAKFEMAADSPTEFHLLVVPAKITFAADGSSLTLHQGGRDMPGKRVVNR